MAGALRVPWVRTFVVITLACTVWYGFISWIAFQVGADWEQVKATLHVIGLRAGISGALLSVALFLLGRKLWMRHRAKHPAAE
jgi:membrane protein DedA with SNARE-associated domain